MKIFNIKFKSKLDLFVKQFKKLIPSKFDFTVIVSLILNIILVSFLFILRYITDETILKLFIFGGYSIFLGFIFYKQTLLLLNKDTKDDQNRLGFILLITILYYFIASFIYEYIKFN